MRGVRLSGRRQIGDSAGHFKHPVMGSRRPLETLSGGFQQRFSCLVRLTKPIDIATVEALVAAILSGNLAFTCKRHALGNLRAAFGAAATGFGEFLRGECRQRDLDIDPVE